MNTRETLNFRIAFFGLIIGLLAPSLIAETLYIDGVSGNDSYSGTKEKPLRTISKAIEVVNASKEPGPTTIKINPGAYCLDEVVIISNSREYTVAKRFTIEATVLPDDSNWTPALMPVISACSRSP